MCNPLVLIAHDKLKEGGRRREVRGKYLVLVLNPLVGPFSSVPSHLLVIDIQICSREPQDIDHALTSPVSEKAEVCA